MSLNRPLAALLDAASGRERVVAQSAGRDGDRTLADLVADVASLAGELEDDRGARWLVETEDPYRIAVSMLAAALCGARIALPPNLQPGTLADLRGQSQRVLADSEPAAAGTGERADRVFLDPLARGRRAASSVDAIDRARIDRDAPLVELFTSGTSGPGKLVTKALRHLEDEVVELERLFGGQLAREASIVATVSAHHLYGLLFRVLWPLSAGRPFERTSYLLPEELLARVAASAHAIVVSSPAHLRHLAASPRLADQSARIDEMFSSGGPLETTTALEIEAVLGRAPVEIFGSTETGGVALRRASAAQSSPLWTVFAPVAIAAAEDGSLEVTSPFVTPPIGASRDAPPMAASRDAPPMAASAERPHTWRMGDLVEIDGAGFRLLGRSDRIAKVGEKTLSLPEIEAHLVLHEFVEAASVGPYRERSVERLGAVVVLTAEGKLRLAQEGRRAIQTALAAHLAPRWARVALPRRWRFPGALPADSRGKLSRESFERELATPSADPRDPLVLAQQTGETGAQFELVVPRDLAYFSGHYGGFPLVPGAVQIVWVTKALGRILGRDAPCERMEAVKFRNVLRPGQLFTMKIDIDRGRSRATFTLSHQDRVFSSGRIVFGV